MPIVVPCPKCGAQLSAPDSAAGKQLRCPKFGCAALANVPALVQAEEVAVVEATPTLPKPRPKPAPVDEDEDHRPRKKPQRDEDDGENDDDNRPRSKRCSDDDEEPTRKKRRREDDDDETDRPRRKKRRKAGKGMSAGPIIVLVFGGIAVIVGAGFGIYALVGDKKSSPTASSTAGNDSPAGTRPTGPSKPTGSGTSTPPVSGSSTPPASGGSTPPPTRPAPPDGWVEFKHPKGLYRVHVPGPSRAVKNALGGFTYVTVPTAKQPLLCQMAADEVPPNVAATYQQALQSGNTSFWSPEVFGGIGGHSTVAMVNWNGRAACQMQWTLDFTEFLQAFPNGAAAANQIFGKTNRLDKDGNPLPAPPSKSVSIARIAMNGNTMYHFTLAKITGDAPSDAEVKAFFDSIEWLK